MDPRTGLPRVGMVGGGQLARMTHQAAIALGQSLRVLGTALDDSAVLVAPDHQIGHHTDIDALRRFATGCDVLTFDHEHVPTEHLRTLIAEGVTVYPGPDALQYAQDKSAMRTRLGELGLPMPAFTVVQGHPAEAIRAFGAEHGWPVVAKTASGGYDGRGVWVIGADPDIDADAEAGVEAAVEAGIAALLSATSAAPDAPDAPDAGWVIEEFVPMRRELAVVLARSRFGQAAVWPVVETVQQQGICIEVIAPAPDLDDDIAAAAGRIGLTVAAELDVVGVLAVELFEVPRSERHPDGLVINELAMRPHNSGHWSMDGAVTGQFEQHLRAVLDYPLGRTEMLSPYTVMGNVLGGPQDGPGAAMGSAMGSAMGMDERVHHLAARFPAVKIHLYGKAFRPGRKLGHVNVSGADLGRLRETAGLAATWLGSGVWTDGYEVHGGTATAKEHG